MVIVADRSGGETIPKKESSRDPSLCHTDQGISSLQRLGGLAGNPSGRISKAETILGVYRACLMPVERASPTAVIVCSNPVDQIIGGRNQPLAYCLTPLVPNLQPGPERAAACPAMIATRSVSTEITSRNVTRRAGHDHGPRAMTPKARTISTQRGKRAAEGRRANGPLGEGDALLDAHFPLRESHVLGFSVSRARDRPRRGRGSRSGSPGV